MADIIFPDAANAFARVQQISSNALRDRLLTTQAAREESAYQRDSQARAIYPKAIAGDAAATSQLAGLSPELHATLMKAKKEGREAQLAEFNQRTQVIGQAAGAVLSVPPDQRPSVYAAQRKRLIDAGLVTADQVPEQYNEGMVTAAARNAQSVDALLKSIDERPQVATPGGMVPTSQMRPGAPAPAQPAPAAAAAPQPAPANGGVVARIIGAESGGNPYARNPNSSATGAGQFINSTWLNTMRAARPDLVAGRSPDEILAMRSDPNLSREMTAYYAQQNGETLRAAGLPVTPGTTYLAHFAGPQGALAVLRSDPSMPVASVLGATVVAANPFLRNMTTGQLAQWADRKMAGSEQAAPTTQNAMGGQSPGGGAPMPVGTAVAAADMPAPNATPVQGEQQGNPFPVFVQGKPYTQGAPPGFQWGVGGNGQWVVMEIPGAAQADKDMVEINDPTSPTGQRAVPRYSVRDGYVPAKDATEGQANANLYATRMRDADAILRQPKVVEAGQRFWGRAATEATYPFTNQRIIPEMITNSGSSPEFQQLRNAELNFLTAVLRRESGAVISPSEFADGERNYFPRPGDDKTVLEQKANNRRMAIEGIGRAAQPGFGAAGPTGTPPPTAAGSPPPAATGGAGNVPPPPPGFQIVR